MNLLLLCILTGSSIFTPLLKGIRLYQVSIAGRQGGVCNFTPSCSRFAYEAIEQYGMPGILIGIDRLLRCNFASWDYAGRYYDVQWVKGKGHILYDPVLKEYLPPPFTTGGASSSTETGGYTRSFADYLYEKRELEAAIIEYKKELSPENPNRTFTQIGKSYWMMGDRKKARDYFKRLNNDTADLFLGLTYLEERKTDSAFYYLQRAEGFKKDVNNLLNGLKYTDRKNPVIAGVLSALVPGSGRIYSGRRGDGIYSFLLVMGNLSISYLYHREGRTLPSYTFLGFASLLYLGNIYGSVRSASSYNETSYDQFVLGFRRSFNQLF